MDNYGGGLVGLRGWCIVRLYPPFYMVSFVKWELGDEGLEDRLWTAVVMRG